MAIGTYECRYVFCRHPEAVKRAFAITTSYMPGETGDDTVDPYAASAQWSRRMMGLKVFMALAEIGLEGYSEMIEHQAALGDLLRFRLQEAGWVIRNNSKLPVVCFSHPDIQSEAACGFRMSFWGVGNGF